MLTIANPAYNTVFEYLLKDLEVAKHLISAISDMTIEEIETPALGDNGKPLKMTGENPKTISRVACTDFALSIKTKRGHEDATIEILKARFADDIQCHPSYRRRPYSPYDYFIYLMNDHIETPGMPVIVQRYALTTRGEYPPVQREDVTNEFIKSLMPTTWIVQLAELKDFRRCELEKLLAVFAKGAADGNAHSITIDEKEVPKKFDIIIQRLVQALTDKQLSAAMSLEDKIAEKLP